MKYVLLYRSAVDGDPFVLQGVVVGREIREWNEGLDRP